MVAALIPMRMGDPAVSSSRDRDDSVRVTAGNVRSLAIWRDRDGGCAPTVMAARRCWCLSRSGSPCPPIGAYPRDASGPDDATTLSRMHYGERPISQSSRCWISPADANRAVAARYRPPEQGHPGEGRSLEVILCLLIAAAPVSRT